MKASFSLVCAFAMACQLGACSSKANTAATPVVEDDIVDDDAVIGEDAAGDTATLTDAKPAGDTKPGTDAAAGTDIKTAELPPPDLKTCAGLSDCVAAACASGATGCEKACFAKASAAELQLAQPLFTCVHDKCMVGTCKDSFDPSCVPTCVGGHCRAELAACVDSGATGTGSCADGATCFGNCEAAVDGYYSCTKGCFGSVSADGMVALDAVATCREQATQAGLDPEVACKAEMLTCLTAGAAGSKACFEVFTCQGTCTEANMGSCMQGCVSELSPAAQKTFAELQPCLGASDMFTNPTCVKSFLACISPSGKNTCSQTMTCQSACQAASGGGDSGTCVFNCLHKATPAAAAAFLKIAPCGGNGSPPAPAQAEACNEAMVACAGPKGSGTCAQIMTCMGGCGEGGSMDCMFGCISSGSLSSGASFAKFLTCKSTCESQCTASTDQQCYEKCLTSSCPTESAACAPN